MGGGRAKRRRTPKDYRREGRGAPRYNEHHVTPSIRILSIVSLLIAITGCEAAVPTRGHWTGTIEHAGAITQLIVDIDHNAHARVTMQDSGVFDVPATVRENDGNVEGEIVRGSATVRFHGKQHGSTIDGDVRAGDFVAQVHLRRAGESHAPGFVEIETAVPTEGAHLAATLLMPVKVKRPPAIVLIHGSHGPSREDLRGPATIFARNGIAALIYDKRDLGNDQSKPHRYSFQELASDARDAVRLLRQRTDIDPAHIGIFGISEGGWIAPLVAGENPGVAFVIDVSGPAVSYAAVEETMTVAQMHDEHASASDIATAVQLLHQTNDYVRHGGDSAALTRDLQAAAREPWSRNIALPRNAPTPDDIRTDVRWRNLDYDPSRSWSQVRAPVFAAWGSNDQHPVTESVEVMRAAFGRAGNRDVSLHVYPNATHELLVSPRPEKWRWPRLDPHFLDDMLRWTAAHTR